jgi:uncharacterized repeat protein (TIGR03803 family)
MTTYLPIPRQPGEATSDNVAVSSATSIDRVSVKRRLCTDFLIFAHRRVVRAGILLAVSVVAGMPSLASDPAVYQQLKSFGCLNVSAGFPHGALIQGSDGALYGTAEMGGHNGCGAVFKLNPDSSGYRVMYSFGDSSFDGQAPQAALLEGTDGVLYGTTANGGADNEGTIFRINKDGSGYAIIWVFLGSFGGGFPLAPLIGGDDGWLYGTSDTGYDSLGAVFKVKKDGTGFTALHMFLSGGGD